MAVRPGGRVVVDPEGMTDEQRFRELFDQLEDAVVEFKLVDHEPHILEVNQAFVEVFGYNKREATGEPLNELIVPADREEEAERFDHRTASGKSNAAVVQRTTVDGPRQFMYRGVPCEADRGFAIYTDVTEEIQRKQHLGVLQRVLRHNLRNDLNIVLGMADEIGEAAESEAVREAAETIRRTANGLAQLSEEAELLRRVFEEPQELEAIELTSVVTSVVETYRGRHGDAEIRTDLPERVVVAANERLETVLGNLVDNAVRHNTAETPRVVVGLDLLDERTAELRVVDNGPGIPQAEQEIILGDEDITPLTHGSGLGLWLVKWITETYDSELSIETPETGGTTIRIRLQRVDGGDSDANDGNSDVNDIDRRRVNGEVETVSGDD